MPPMTIGRGLAGLVGLLAVVLLIVGQLSPTEAGMFVALALAIIFA